MSYTKFSATCGMTIVAHGTTTFVYPGNHISQCLEFFCTGTEKSLSVFADGITNDPVLLAKMDEVIPENEPSLVALGDRVPSNVVRRFKDTDQHKITIKNTDITLLRFDQPNSPYPCTLAESWTIDSTDGGKSVRTVIDMYNITATSEKFTYVVRNFDSSNPIIADPITTIVTTSGKNMTFNMGRSSEIKMYCYHCHDNVRTHMCPCKQRRYCSSQCQKADWKKGHKHVHDKLIMDELD